MSIESTLKEQKPIIYPELVMMIALWLAKPLVLKLSVEHISELFTLEDIENFPIRPVAMKRMPGGVFSEDVASFFGRLESSGFARESTDISGTVILTSLGLELISKDIDEAETEIGAYILRNLTCVIFQHLYLKFHGK